MLYNDGRSSQPGGDEMLCFFWFFVWANYPKGTGYVRMVSLK